MFHLAKRTYEFLLMSLTYADMSLFVARYKRRRDPEHLPPSTAWQKFSVVFQKLGDFFGSSKVSV